MISATTRAALVGAVVLFVAGGVLAGAAAADSHEDDEWTVAFDGEVDVEDNGGEGGFTCTGMPTDHDCDKGGDMYAGPVTVDYDGYNRGSLEGGEYEFEDRFVVTDGDGRGAVVVFPCEFQDDAPEDNPCPATAEEYESDERGDRGNGDKGGDGDDGGADASDDRRDNGNDGGNGNDDDNASDQRDGEDDSDGPVGVDVTVDPPSDGPSL